MGMLQQVRTGFTDKAVGHGGSGYRLV